MFMEVEFKMNDTVLSKLEEIRDLPTLSVVVERLREVLKDPDVDADHISMILEDDPAIAMRILKLVNSVYYGVHEPIGSLRQAVACLGQDEVENIALTAAVLDVFPVRAGSMFDRKQFWLHCIFTGLAANVISEHSDVCRGVLSADQLHLAGVLHDVGKVIYEMYFHHQLADVIRLSATSSLPLYQVERGVFGTDHAETGGWLAKKWNLPREMTAVIRWHHRPGDAPEYCRLIVQVCHLANWLCNTSGFGNGGDALAPVLDDGVLQALHIEEDSCPQLIDEVAGRLESCEFVTLLD